MIVEDDSFWDFYWEVRLQEIETLGKRAALIAASQVIRKVWAESGAPLRLLELGCGDGQVIGPLYEAHNQHIRSAVGVDYLLPSIQASRRRYPGIRSIHGDFTDPALLESLGHFELVLLVNALHEVFSAAFSEELGEVDVPAAKLRVEAAFSGAVQRVVPGGFLLLFDGLEPPHNPAANVRLRFADRQALRHFETFAAEYRPFKITYSQLEDPLRIKLSWRSFTRYITKSIFLGKALWESERLESYQYFTEDEFRAMVDRTGLELIRLETLTVNEDKWQRAVTIDTPGVSFPVEHILLILKKHGN
jgi:SAM-dependent methyltransferase